MNSESIAHVAEDGRIHLLEEHLRETARRAGEFAAVFGCGEWGRVAGLWHDLGKYSNEFQRYIRGAGSKTDHSSAGAIYAVKRFEKFGRIITYLIAGHHAGLPNWLSDSEPGASLAQRMTRTELFERLESVSIPSNLLDQVRPSDRPKTPATELAASLWIRMLFSCLVDADFLDTEAFFDSTKNKKRAAFPQIESLIPIFETFMADKQAAAPDTPVNRIRGEILRQCVQKGSSTPGFYSLTVPTGGGKTLSSMAFALKHYRGDTEGDA